CGFQRPAAIEDTEPPEEALLALVEEIVTPADRIAQGLLPRWQVQRAPGENRQYPFEVGEHRRRGQQFEPCRRRFQRERQAIQPDTDRGHRCRVRCREGKSMMGRLCPINEQRDRWACLENRWRGVIVLGGKRQWRYGELALAREMERGPTRYQYRQQRR